MVVRLMTHNQWWCDENNPAWAEKGEDCSAQARIPGFIRVYRETKPDVIGCQEVSAHMADLLMCGLSAQGMGYALLWGRDTPILYRTDRWELIDSDYFIYSESVPGLSGSFNNSRTKSYCLAVLREKESGEKLAFLSTHLWWKEERVQPGSDAARVYQISLAIDALTNIQQRYGCGAVLVGDLNAGYDAPALKHAFAAGFLHAHDLASEADDSCGLHECFGWGYHPYYRSDPFERAIDHILIRPAPGKEPFGVTRFARYSPEYYLPLSDHSPAFADVVL